MSGFLDSFGKLLRTTAFKLSAFYLVIFAVTIFLTLGYVTWNAQRLVNQQMVSTIEAEITGLAEQFERGGMRQLVRSINRRSRSPSASLYLITTRAGNPIAGNVESVSASLLGQPGEHRISYERVSGEEGVQVHRALVRVYHLPGGNRLLVGRDIEENERMRDVVHRAFVWSLLWVFLFGGVGGWIVAKRMLGRVEAMTLTTRSIMAGDLGGRLAIAGSGDELDRLADSLNTMLGRIEELMAGMRQVSDNIAHDLKTPLTRLRNHADDALREARTPDELRAALEAAIEESDNLIRVFNALLMIARLEAGNAEDLVRDFDAADTVTDVAELYDAVVEEAGMKLEARIASGLQLRGSPELLAQALSNLIDNALKYAMPEADADVAEPIRLVADRIGNPDGDRIRISLSDHGPGIPEEDRERVLGRFVRLEDSRNRPGFGLGLSLVAAIARLHGGTLRLEDGTPGLVAVLDLPAAA
ncbi:MAG: HAMP domain-containing protein [Salinarimonas sp.]|nr:HAMP domain-containing protein [Salinarimonas sp.]